MNDPYLQSLVETAIILVLYLGGVAAVIAALSALANGWYRWITRMPEMTHEQAARRTGCADE